MKEVKVLPSLAKGAGDSFWFLFSVKKELPFARHEGRQAHERKGQIAIKQGQIKVTATTRHEGRKAMSEKAKLPLNKDK